MKITWLGHACFKVETDGYAVVLDPYEDGCVPGLGNIRETADLVICSHGHHDHNATSCVTLRGNGSSPFSISQLDSFHDDVQGAKRGPNKITVLDDGQVRVAHLGDLGCDLTEDQLAALAGLDYVLIPVGGFYTIDGNKAAEIIAQLQPKHVIPMHYQDQKAGFGYEVISPVSVFTDHMRDVALLEASSVDTAASTPAQVLVLKPALLSR